MCGLSRHNEIVITLEDERVQSIQHGMHSRASLTLHRVSSPQQAQRAVAEDELRRFACVEWLRVRLDRVIAPIAKDALQSRRPAPRKTANASAAAFPYVGQPSPATRKKKTRRTPPI